jgi:hypothetical protein
MNALKETLQQDKSMLLYFSFIVYMWQCLRISFYSFKALIAVSISQEIAHSQPTTSLFAHKSLILSQLTSALITPQEAWTPNHRTS